MTGNYRPLGVRLAIEGDVTPLLTAVEAGLGQYPADFGLRGTLTFEARTHPDGTSDPGWPRIDASDDAHRLSVRCGSSSAVLDYSCGVAAIDLAESMLDVGDAMRLFAESVFTAAMVRAGELHAVHSGLVVHDGVGLVLRGQSGAGKSTLTYASMRRGAAVCSDDWIYAATRREPGRFAGYPWRMMMTEEAATRFPELLGAPTAPHPAAEGRKIPIFPPVDQQAVVADATAVVLLDPDVALSLEPIDTDEAVGRFWASSLPTEREYLDAAWVEALLTRPTFRLQRGRDPVAAAVALQDLAASLR